MMSSLHISRIGIERVLVCVLMFMGLSARSVLAQSQEISAELDAPEVVYVGEPFAVNILAHGDRSASQPQFPAVPDLTSSFVRTDDRSSSFTTIINGVVRSRSEITTAFVYRCVADREGEITIPSIPVTIGSNVYQTQPRTIRVARPSADSSSFLEIKLDAQKIYVGQPVSITIRWYIGKNVASPSLRFPFNSDLADLILPQDPRSPSQRRMAQFVGDDEYYELPFNDEKIIAERGQSLLGSDLRTSLTVHFTLIPSQPGELVLGPATMNFEAAVGQRPARFGDAPWNDRSIYERQVCESAPIRLKILPLPDQGRPADFSGLVGKYQIAATASPLQVSVGQPIDFNIRVSGPGPLDRVPPIDLAAEWQHTPNLKTPREPLLPVITDQGAVFSAKVRARDDSVKELPPVRLSYFDPESGEYKLAETSPISLTVTGSSVIGAAESEESEESDIAAASKKSEIGISGIRDISTVPIGHGWLFAAALANWDGPAPKIILGFSFAFVMAGLLVRLARRSQSADPHRHRIVQAHRAALRNLRRSQAGPCDLGVALGDIIRCYIAQACQHNEACTTPTEAVSLVRTYIDETTCRELESLLTRLDARFDPNHTNTKDSETVHDVRQILNRIHHSLIAQHRSRKSSTREITL